MNPKTWTRQELFDLVWAVPLSTICKENQLRLAQLQQTCRDLSIPLPPNGHWSKLRFGKADPKPALPNIDHKQETFVLEVPQVAKEVPETATRQASLTVPDRLVHPDSLIEAARKSFEERAKYYKGNELWWTGPNVLDIKVSKASIARALRVMDTIIKYLKASEWTVRTSHNETYVEKKGVSLRIAFREVTKKVASANSWTPNEPTGKLVFKFDGYGRSECKIGEPLETEPLLRVLDRMEAIVAELNEIWERSRIRKEKEQAITRAKQEQLERRQRELDDFKTLLNHARRWQEAEMIRKYVYAVNQENNLDKSCAETFGTQWAMDKADWYDPLKNAPDDLLAGADRDHLLLPSGND